MKKQVLAVMSLCCIGSVFAKPASPDDDVLFVPSENHPIVGSRFSELTDFQKSLLTLATNCKIKVVKPGAFVDGKMGRETMNLIKQVAGCDLYKSALSGSLAAKGVVTTKLWKLVASDVPVPDALSRSFIMSLGSEATDYTVIEFNTPSDGGIITWGPLGATAGQVYQVQKILSTVDKEIPKLIDNAFGTEAQSIRLLAETKNVAAAAKIALAVNAVKTRKAIWHAGFKVLGEDARVRAIYGRVMNPGILEAVSNFYRSYWAHGWCPTEVDLGFFIDRAVQMTLKQNHTNQAAEDVIEIEKASGSILTPAQRRRAISANFWPGKLIYVGDRLARDVAYYIDYIPRAELTNETLLKLVAKRGAAQRQVPGQLNDEVKRWNDRLGVSANAYGLVERPAAVPVGLVGEPPACTIAYAGMTQNVIIKGEKLHSSGL
ncbi:hypothetical protein [Pantoea agglomerans]|uniref:hypothetical protein n=1 Tax=Enterobacter agglomerans TaxID=549 RepID=UPI0011B07C41|nr:hypothetical protein [Pantoea agglomerans]UBN56552.1 hypothetical protein LB453_22320 [Pantoea agglomerans]